MQRDTDAEKTSLQKRNETLNPSLLSGRNRVNVLTFLIYLHPGEVPSLLLL